MKRKIKVHTLDKVLNAERKKGKSIGLAPTMGALHSGHLSLIASCQRKSDVSVCSIFVNPTQFNDKKDLVKYPRTLKNDSRLLSSVGTDYLFTPTLDQIYPSDLNTSIEIDLAGLDTVMEGAHRPGHFAGVVQVVKRLLDIVKPDHLYMGQKDFQQFTIIQHMIKVLKIPTELVVVPIMREKNGLAMSSRNERLLPKHRKKAPIIFKTLSSLKEKLDSDNPSNLIDWAMENMTIDGFKPEYVSLIDGNTLQALKSIKNCDYVVACTAVWAGEVRLIDNVILKR